MAATRLEQCETALKQIEEYDRRFPGDPALESVKNQLRYLIQLERGEEADRSRLGELTLGRYAMYALSNIISFDLAELLCEISGNVRRQLRREGRERNRLIRDDMRSRAVKKRGWIARLLGR